jgi:hypothetical protein
MKLSRGACLLTLAGTMHSQTKVPVVLAEKNVVGLQKIRGVIVVDGADGIHPPPEVNSSASAEFALAISKQLEQLTCWKLLTRTSPTKKSPTCVPTGGNCGCLASVAETIIASTPSCQRNGSFRTFFRLRRRLRWREAGQGQRR